ncbi:putative ferric-chelate reductase 1 [Petromyzon marinus]|uniref:putative ferric-chelate reductase 1 n=1 Tax=Petromyzon marinus TaxID=7757 RepID=UPI003F6EE328
MSNASARVADGMLQCSFTLSQVATEPRKADLKKQYYLFLAHGETDDGEIEKHDVQPMVSRYRIAPLGSPVEVAVTRSNNLVKAHGALMLVAWLSLCSVGVVLARFFKPVWPNTKLLGEKVWFQLHRGLMVLAVLTTITAFVIPFCYRLGWSGLAAEALLEILGCFGADHKSGESFEMSHVVQGLREGKLQHNHNSKLHNVKSAVLGVYVAGNVAFLIALLVGVGNV